MTMIAGPAMAAARRAALPRIKGGVVAGTFELGAEPVPRSRGRSQPRLSKSDGSPGRTNTTLERAAIGVPNFVQG